jgi:hypothetical protein
LTASASVSFKEFSLPDGKGAWIPSDVDLRLPEGAAVDHARLHALAFIPWDDRYLLPLDPSYRGFFQSVLPYLHVRTTDVHVATCLPFARELIAAESEPVDQRVVHIAFILHDCGWSQMSEEEIADSLGVEGLALSTTAMGPKTRHAELGRDLAQRLLREFPTEPLLTASQEEMICRAILFHDKPELLSTQGDFPASVRVVCDVDHLWPFTHENFWQDTVRKALAPPAYLANLGADLESYFVGEAGRRKARQMLEVRAQEVDAWAAWTARQRA